MTDEVKFCSVAPLPSRHHLLDCGGKSLDLSHVQIMGILNVTPDSFSDGGALYSSGAPSLDKALDRVECMIAEGASIIDVGGESTRPGAKQITIAQEIDRVLPVIEAIAKRFEIVISVDTSSPELMVAAAKAGAGLINDVRALERTGAINAAVSTGLPVCLMHMRGEPATMQINPEYQHVVRDVVDYLSSRIEMCLNSGLDKSKILVDPGFGFGKSKQHNLMLLNHLHDVLVLGCPILVGLSRKSLVDQVLGRQVHQRLAGSIALAALAVSRGASIVRTHDVIETVDAIRLCEAVIHARV